MSSGDHLWSRQWNHEQLAMFMPAKHLIDLPFYEPDREWVDPKEEEWIDSDGESSWEEGGGGQEDDDQFWDRKLDESYGSTRQSLRDDIEESGQVKVPVKLTIEDTNLGTLQRIRQGHHRIAAANEVNPDMEVPIRHVWDTGDWIGNAPTDTE
jgi:hypothetical protein